MGEAVAVVVAQTRYLAEDAAALVAVDYEPLPAVSDCRRRCNPERHARIAAAAAMFWSSSGRLTATSRTPRAPHRASIASSASRRAHSIERGALATYDGNEERLTVWSSTQLAHEMRAFLVTLLRLDENQLRVVAPDVGGGTRAKFVMYPEEVTLAASCLLLRRRSSRWIEDRREHFLAAIQERDR